MEAPSGFEPLNRSFADCSLNHLGTAPSSIHYKESFFVYTTRKCPNSNASRALDNNYLRGNTGISREEGPVEDRDNSAIEGATGLAG